MRDLICNDWFNHHTPRTHFDLELHLRCIVASLRLLSAHGIQTGSGSLTFAFYDELYNRMAWWQTFHLGQVQGARSVEDKVKNYNNEFLIVYARDLIAALPSDRTIATNLATRLIAAAASLGHAVCIGHSALTIVFQECCAVGPSAENYRPIQISALFLAHQVPHHGRSLSFHSNVSPMQ